MLVQLWPEFDEEAMLVIYRIQLAANLDYPLELSLPMPSAVEDANAVAVPGENGSLVITPYELEEQGDWTLVHLTVDAPLVQFEYYDPGLTISGNQRDYQYLWEGSYSVDSFTVQVEEPFSASLIQFAPELEEPFPGPDTLLYHNGDFGSVAAGEELTLDIAYTREGSLLTAEFLDSIGSTDPGVSVAASSFDWVRWVGWGLGILGVAILAYAGYSWLNPSPTKILFGRAAGGQLLRRLKMSSTYFVITVAPRRTRGINIVESVAHCLGHEYRHAHLQLA